MKDLWNWVLVLSLVNAACDFYYNRNTGWFPSPPKKAIHLLIKMWCIIKKNMLPLKFKSTL